MSQLSLCRTVATLQRETVLYDASGGQTKVWADLTADVPCDIQPASSQRVTVYAAKKIEVSHTIYLSQDVSAKATDRFVSGTRIFRIKGYKPSAPGYEEWPSEADVMEQVL